MTTNEPNKNIHVKYQYELLDQNHTEMFYCNLCTGFRIKEIHNFVSIILSDTKIVYEKNVFISDRTLGLICCANYFKTFSLLYETFLLSLDNHLRGRRSGFTFLKITYLLTDYIKCLLNRHTGVKIQIFRLNNYLIVISKEYQEELKNKIK